MEREVVSPEGGPRYDKSQWPVFTMIMPAQPMSEVAWREHLQVVDELLQRGERMALLVETHGSAPLTAKQRQSLGVMLERRLAENPRVLAGVGVVLSSLLARGILTAIRWVVRSPFPSRTFSDRAEALVWLRTQIAR